ncbi:Hint domain-containing protein [Asaia lannensis]|uniref:Hint domain-containing protein n=1 Tax=Asaia lannensis NBRC 102526 TaxID=1307926 RepID=A0ABT1CK40_9PROT|nr:Hint domain-containing protein [Asaia lannensis]MCO6160951.1 Hint domain-containing protein [Asaia lannensis NBRC 102526]
MSATLWGSAQSASGETKTGETNTIAVNQNCTGCWVAGGFIVYNQPFTVAGTLVFNLHQGSSISLGGWSANSNSGATISEGGVIQVNGSNKIGVVDPSGIGIPYGYFNISGNTVNNGTINIGWSTVYNYGATSTITGKGVINLKNVTLATDLVGSKYCYWNTTFYNISGQTINLENSQISFGSRDGKGSITDVTINCQGGGNYIAINAGIFNNITGLKIRGYGNGDIIDLGYLGSADTFGYDPSTGILTVSTWVSGSSAPVKAIVQIDIGLGYDPAGFQQVPTYNGIAGFGKDTGVQYLGAPPCYLAGTLIETARGHVAVEEIVPGDFLVAYENGRTVTRRVIWVGKSRVKAEHPTIIVRRNALGENLPFCDLHITQEHCLFFDGCFVPARMLVNGHSIACDIQSDNYDVYHVELETHSIIRANGILTESFLDTGHVAFEGRESRDLEWGAHSAAPLRTDRAFVEPIFRMIVDRVPGVSVNSDCCTHDSDDSIAMLLNGKTRVCPTRRKGRTLVFSFNEPIRSLSIMTAAASPSSKIGPFVDDRRLLGALVGKMYLYTPDGMTAYETHLVRPAMTGWHHLESTEFRWTGGKAELPGLECEFAATVLSLELHA